MHVARRVKLLLQSLLLLQECAMAVAMAFTISEGTKMVTSPAHADQEDADSFDPLYYAACSSRPSFLRDTAP